MKFIYLLSALLALQSCFSSCEKKSEDTKSNASIHGLWIGTYTDERNTTEYFSFVIKPDGKLLVESRFNGAQQLAQGTWSLNGKTLLCNYAYFWGTQAPTNTVQISTATYDEQRGQLVSGAWQNTSPNSKTGTFTMSEVN